MAEPNDKEIAKGAGLGVVVVAASLTIPIAWGESGIRGLTWIVLGSLAVAAVGLWLVAANAQKLIGEAEGSKNRDHLGLHAVMVCIGLVLVVLGAFFLEESSAADHRPKAGLGVGLLLLGLIPIGQVVRVDVRRSGKQQASSETPRAGGAVAGGIAERRASAEPDPESDSGGVEDPDAADDEPPKELGWPLALFINVLVTGLTVGIAGAILGAGWWSPIAMIPWVGMEYASRNPKWQHATTLAGVIVIAIACVVFLLGDISTVGDLGSPGAALVVGFLLVVGSRRKGPYWFSNPTYAGFAGGLIIAGSAAMIGVVGSNLDPLILAVVIIAPILFGVSLVAKGEGILIAAAVGLFVVWAVDGRTSEPQPLADSRQDYVIAAFGDSYMAGEGIGHFYEDSNTGWQRDFEPRGVNGCRRSPDAYPVRVAATVAEELGATVSLDFRACSGAKAISNRAWDSALNQEIERLVDFENSENSLIGQFQRFDDARGDRTRVAGSEPGKSIVVYGPARGNVDVVLLSLGGNDGGFSTIGTACFMPHSCGEAVEAIREQDLLTVSRRVEVALNEAEERFPDVPILVVSIPRCSGATRPTVASRSQGMKLRPFGSSSWV